MAALLATNADLRTKSRDLVRRNAWAQAGIEAFVANAMGTGIKPQSHGRRRDASRSRCKRCGGIGREEADAAGQTDFYGLQALACRAMLEGGEVWFACVPRGPRTAWRCRCRLQLLEPEHLPHAPEHRAANRATWCGRASSSIGWAAGGLSPVPDRIPRTGALAPMSGQGGHGHGADRCRARSFICIGALRPGQIRGEPWLSRALVKLNELDQYDDAELVRKKTAAMFAGFVTRQSPEDNLLGEGAANANGIALAGMEPGTLQILEPGEDMKFSDPADVGGSYAEFLRTQFRAVAAAMGITYEQLTGDLTRRELLVDPRRAAGVSPALRDDAARRARASAVSAGVAAWMQQAVLAGAWPRPASSRRTGAGGYLSRKWIPQGWQWVDPLKEFKSMLTGDPRRADVAGRKRSRPLATTPRMWSGRSPPTTPGPMRWD